MNKKKFNLLNIQKKQKITHADIQTPKPPAIKGGRPRKQTEDKLSCVVSINVNMHEKKTLEEEAENMGVTVLSLIRMSLVRALKKNFVMSDMSNKLYSSQAISNKIMSGKVVKQYAIPVTKGVKEKLEDWSIEFMVSISNLLKMALRNSGYCKI